MRPTYEFAITCEPKDAYEKTQVTPRNAAGFLRGAMSLEKDKESGSGQPHLIYKI